MSDLAPFVAAVLKDKALHELMEEVKMLREKNRALSSIEITGPNGTPVYASRCLDSGEYNDDRTRWMVELDEVATIPPGAFQLAEIWIAGSFRANFNDRYLLDSTIWAHSSSPFIHAKDNTSECHSSFNFADCCVAVLTQWASRELEPQSLQIATARIAGKNNALLRFLSEPDSNMVSHFLGISIPVRDNEKLIAAARGPCTATETADLAGRHSE